MNGDGFDLERERRRLQQKLERAEANRRRLEDQRESSAILHVAVVRELESSRLALEEKNAQLEALTAQLATSERLATQATRAKSTFLANMSHELRTPLNAILGYSELLGETLSDDHPGLGEHELERIQAAGRHLLTLIDQILDLSKIEAGRMHVAHGCVDLEHIVASLVDTIRPLAERKGLALRVDVAPGTLWTDGQKLTQILLNLLSNAVKFTERGSIELTVARRDEGVWFAVQDTGIGMTAEEQSRVFLPFEQADPSTTRRFGGTGLGLAISERFAALLGGRLTVHSEPDCGTRFEFTLPQAA